MTSKTRSRGDGCNGFVTVDLRNSELNFTFKDFKKKDMLLKKSEEKKIHTIKQLRGGNASWLPPE